MCNFINKIIKHKREEIKKKKNKTPLDLLIKRASGQSGGIGDFKNALLGQKNGVTAIIAEIKLASPSSGIFRSREEIETQAILYEKAGVDAISVVTEKKFFHGDLNYISRVKKVVKLPLLLKDFIIDNYQLYEAKLVNANAVLLITKILNNEKLKQFVNQTMELELEPVVEVSTEKELEDALSTTAAIIAVNARDLNDFSVSIEKACRIGKKIPSDRIFLGFSGIKTRDDVESYQNAGAKGILVGTTLMQADDINKIIKSLKAL